MLAGRLAPAGPRPPKPPDVGMGALPVPPAAVEMPRGMEASLRCKEEPRVPGKLASPTGEGATMALDGKLEAESPSTPKKEEGRGGWLVESWSREAGWPDALDWLRCCWS